MSLLLLNLVAPNQSPLRDLSKQPTAYVVGYSHLDTQWCWSYRHSILDCIPQTLHENFDLFEKYPGYVFNWTGAKRYQFMKEYYPTDYAKLKEYVAKGQWAVTGSGWDECDANIPSPESIIRQVLYSNRFFKKEFGKTSNNYLIPDVFGFPASLPTILSHCGLKGMSTCKLTYGAGAAVPIPFNVGNWVGPDGSSIVAALNCQSYHTGVKEDLSSSKALLDRIADEKGKSGLALDYTYYGTGDEGGSPGEESVRWVQQSLAGKGPTKVVAGTADQMFDDLTVQQKAALPSYQGDLLLTQHSAGTATSGATMKRLNHDNELLANAAERAAVSARLLTGAVYPQARITDAWQRFLGGQMHDILPGTSIPQAYTFAWNDQYIALNESGDVLGESVRNVTSKMDTRAKGVPVVVFNPLSFDREDVVEADAPVKTGVVHVFDTNGKEVPAQRSGSKILFLASTPSLGYRTFDIRTSGEPVKSPLKVWQSGLENDRYRVQVDLQGDISSVFDKQAGKELLSAPARLAFLYQKPQRHPAWNMDWADQQKPPVAYVDGPAKISISEQGPVRVSLRIEREARGSKFVQFVRLSAGQAGNRVEIENQIHWKSTECSLKATFPLTVENPKATYNWEVGTVERGNNQEKLYEAPSHQWFDLTDTSQKYGVSVLNVAKYGSDKPDDHTLRLTLLYTPGVRDNFQHQATGDWGHHKIVYALSGHQGDWRTGSAQDEAARLNQPLLPFIQTSHPGPLGRSISLAKVNAPNVRIEAMKKAEDSDETIVRLVENQGRNASDVRVTFDRPVESVREVDGQEYPIKAHDISRTGKQIRLTMTAYHPRALAIRFAPNPISTASGMTLKLPFNSNVASDFGAHTGSFDGEGRSLPKELLPPGIVSGGVTFRLEGSARNAVSCTGQTVALPPSSRPRRLAFLAASSAGDRLGTFRVGGQDKALTIQAWDGFIGQCDNRIWEGATEDERTSNWKHQLLGIAPAYVKPAPIAWYADHRRLPDGSNDAYHFAYLFRYELNIPAGTTSIRLPNDPKVKITAATLLNSPTDN